MESRDPCEQVYDLIDRVFVKMEMLESRLARDAQREGRRAAAKLWIIEEIYDELALLRKAARECIQGVCGLGARRAG